MNEYNAMHPFTQVILITLTEKLVAEKEARKVLSTNAAETGEFLPDQKSPVLTFDNHRTAKKIDAAIQSNEEDDD